jgi:hypothetical protein
MVRWTPPVGAYSGTPSHGPFRKRCGCEIRRLNSLEVFPPLFGFCATERRRSEVTMQSGPAQAPDRI